MRSALTQVLPFPSSGPLGKTPKLPASAPHSLPLQVKQGQPTAWREILCDVQTERMTPGSTWEMSGWACELEILHLLAQGYYQDHLEHL